VALEDKADSAEVLSSREPFRLRRLWKCICSNDPGFIPMQVGLRIPKAVIACLSLLALGTAGCACPCPWCAPTACPGWQSYSGIGNSCFGYYPTCWRMWSPECPSCPSYAAPEPLPTEIAPQQPAEPPSASKLPGIYSPLPAVPTPGPEQQESRSNKSGTGRQLLQTTRIPY